MLSNALLSPEVCIATTYRIIITCEIHFVLDCVNLRFIPKKHSSGKLFNRPLSFTDKKHDEKRVPGAVLQTLCAFSDIVTVKVKTALTGIGSSVQFLDYQHSHWFELHIGQHYKASFAEKRRCTRTTQGKTQQIQRVQHMPTEKMVWCFQVFAAIWLSTVLVSEGMFFICLLFDILQT